MIGVSPEDFSSGSGKGLIYGKHGLGEESKNIVLLLNLLADFGVLEMRNGYEEFRWPRTGPTSYGAQGPQAGAGA